MQEEQNKKNLPEPKPGKTSGGLGLLAFFALLTVCIAVFWLSRPAEIRDQWREKAAVIIDNATSGTPLAGSGNVLRDSPPPPPDSVTNPRTEPGTLAGQNVQGTIGAPVDKGIDNGISIPNIIDTIVGNNQKPQEQGQVQSREETVKPVPKVTEDARVRPDIIDDLAIYIVNRYRPSSGMLGFNLPTINQRYGSKLASAQDGGRSGILRYIFHPTMLKSLYGLYSDRFMQSLDNAASARKLPTDQIKKMYNTLASQCMNLASTLDAISQVNDFKKKLKAIDVAAQKSNDLNAQVTAAIFELDAIREKNGSQSTISSASSKVDSLSARYRKSVDEYNYIRKSLIADIRKNGGQNMDDASLMFVTFWIDRRLQSTDDALESAQAASGILRDLADRCINASQQSKR